MDMVVVIAAVADEKEDEMGDLKHVGSALTRTTEEASEVITELSLIIKIISKIERFGWITSYPGLPRDINISSLENHIASLDSELDDLKNVLSELSVVIAEEKKKYQES